MYVRVVPACRTKGRSLFLGSSPNIKAPPLSHPGRIITPTWVPTAAVALSSQVEQICGFGRGFTSLPCLLREIVGVVQQLCLRFLARIFPLASKFILSSCCFALAFH